MRRGDGADRHDVRASVSSRPRSLVLTAVAWCSLAMTAAGDELLVLRHGDLVAGTLRACVGPTCRLDSAAVARADIAWIFFDPATHPAPVPESTEVDQLHLRDGRTIAGALVGVSLGAVVTAAGSFDRSEVLWLRLAGPEPAADEPRPSAAAGDAEEPPPPEPAAEDGGGAEPAPPPGSAAAPPPSSPTALGHPLAGCRRFAEVEEWHGTFAAEFLYRVDRDPSGQYTRLSAGWLWTVRGELSLEQEDDNPFVSLGGGSANAVVELEETFGYPDWAYLASNTGRGRIDLRGDVFRPTLLLQAGCRYTVSFGQIWLPVDQRITRTDTGETRSSVGTATFDIQVSDEAMPDEGLVLSGRRVMPIRGDGAGYADVFVPMQGSEAFLFSGALQTEPPPTGTVRWAICPVGVSCPLGPAPEPEADRCSDPEPQRGLLEVEWLKREQIVEALRAEWARLEEAKAGFDQESEAWRAAAAICGIEQIASTALSSAAGAFGSAVGLIQKIASGDLSYLITNDELGLALDLLKTAISLSDGVTAADMRGYLDACSTLPDDLEAAARRFVDFHEALGAAIPRVQEQVNRTRQQDLVYWNAWHHWYAACLDWAECEELDPERCEPPPDSPAAQLGDRPPPRG